MIWKPSRLKDECIDLAFFLPLPLPAPLGFTDCLFVSMVADHLALFSCLRFIQFWCSSLLTVRHWSREWSCEWLCEWSKDIISSSEHRFDFQTNFPPLIKLSCQLKKHCHTVRYKWKAFSTVTRNESVSFKFSIHYMWIICIPFERGVLSIIAQIESWKAGGLEISIY